ncbi:hypothetical protein EV656_105119 [Rhodovulum adriaticum]|uniref:Uncharacterized protein n=2 Tax=Rhodovulum adriaticum TaxID=35804 RepID=A0A4R2NMD0_RHOAD|nr:hypothetical protein [Rhodovulum adriaticum]TCP22819.1 hypothetical protein EV656_105119 [Rhodovulum adriaticum]
MLFHGNMMTAALALTLVPGLGPRPDLDPRAEPPRRTPPASGENDPAKAAADGAISPGAADRCP